jgi:diguanylate cyclase (GGDEF)-like protein/PAS domain S-box-containing protein
MASIRAARQPYAVICAISALISAAWVASLVVEFGGPAAAQAISNVGLTLVAILAAAACGRAALRGDRYRRTWAFLAFACWSWGCGQIVWTIYESVLQRELPFPSFADVFYLGFPPLAAVALLFLPGTTQSFAGRMRTVIDGLMIAGSLLLTTWVLALEPIFHAAGDELLPQLISLAYPLGDTVVVTIVLYVILRGRALRRESFPLILVGFGLVAFSVGDTGFYYLIATGAYASGNLIDAGWFVGFAFILVAALRPAIRLERQEVEESEGRPLGLLLPYAAVVMGLATSSLELLRTGATDPVVSWIRTFIIVTMVVRQILTLLENRSLTRHLQARVVELRGSEQRFKALVQHSSDVVTVIDVDGNVRYQSESIERVFGYFGDALLDRPLSDLLDDASAQRLAATVDELTAEPYGIRVLELSVRHRSGRMCQAETTVTNLLDEPSVGGLVLNISDISERKTLEDQLVYSAFHDSLTTLANRALFRDRVDETLRAEEMRRRGVGVLFLDLDGFKQVNDLLGHASGDLLLVQVAERLRSCVRPTDTVARLGGDEFAVLLHDADDAVAEDVAQRITGSLRDPFRVDHQEIHVRGSVGLAIATADVSDADRLLRNADLAMYRAKAAGEGGFERYDPEMHVDLVERLQLEADLRRGIEAGELALQYQPVVALDTSRIEGVEALVRWKHPTRGLMPPGWFIPIAEESGLIVPMGRWVLEQAVKQAASWHAKHPATPLSVSVNISAGQLRSSFVEEVESALRASGLEPGFLVLEMTESVLMDHTDENLEVFMNLKRLGVRLAIDDFGTGYSSLSYLHRFPVDILKIDRSFVDLISESEQDSELVRTIVRLGQSLRMRTVAEGIEGIGQIEVLRAMECELGQGYHFSRPLASRQIDRLLAGSAVGNVKGPRTRRGSTQAAA